MKDFIKKLHCLFITTCLLFASNTMVMAQDNIEYNQQLNSDRIENAVDNNKENIERANHGLEQLRVIKLEAGKNVLDQWNKLSEQERDALYQETESIIKTSGCDALSVEAEKIKKDKELFEQRLANQNYNAETGLFNPIENLRLELDRRTGVMQSATSGIGPLAQDQGSIIKKREEMQKELQQKEQELPKKEKDYEDAKDSLASCYNDDSGSYSRCNNEERRKREQRVAETKKIYEDHMARINFLKNRIWSIVNVDGRQATAGATAAVSKANARGAEAEQVYEQMIKEITRQTKENEQALIDAMKRLEEAKERSAKELANLQLSNNADFRLWDQIKNSYGGTSDFDKNNQKRTENDIDVLAMSSSALSSLRCEDVSDVKTKSYNLFRAASANYMAALINERTEFTRVNQGCFLACVSIDDLKLDQKDGSKQYPAFAKKDFGTTNPNCKTFEGKDGMLVNDPNPDDDKDEQIKSFERVANAQHQLVTNIELKKAHREDGKKMFQDAFNAAMMEYTTKVSRVAAANAQLQRAKAWQKKAENSIIIYVAIVAGLAGCAWGPCAGAFAVAVALLMWHRGDKSKADQDVAKWEEKLKHAKLHGHLACNYPGEVVDDIPEVKGNNELNLFLDENTPLIYPYSELLPLTSSPPPMKGEKQITKKEDMAAHMRKVEGLKKKYDNNALFYQEVEKDSESIGLNQGTKSFQDYLKKKLGAWRLQSFNASKMIDYSKVTFTTDHLNPMYQNNELEYRWNDSNYMKSGQKMIVQNTGYPAPETRIVYMQAVINLLNGNLDNLGDALAMSKIYANQYAQLLSRARNHLTMDMQGLEQDTSKLDQFNKNGCLKQSENGEFVQDPTCACRETNSCSKYTAEGFGFKAPYMNLNSKNIKKKEYALDSGSSTESANTEGLELAGSKNALGGPRTTQLKLDTSNRTRFKSVGGSDDGSNGIFGKNGANGINGANANGSANGSGPGSGNGLNLNNENGTGDKVRYVIGNNENNGKKDGKTSDTNTVAASSPSLTPSQAIQLESSKQKALARKKNGEVNSIDFSQFNNSSFADVQGDYIEKDGQKFIAKKNSDGTISYYTEQGVLVSNPNDYQNLDAKYKDYKYIHPTRGPSLFNIVSRRYKNTAFKIFFPKDEAQ
ncbi:hypothetical protein M899_1975 [Bacteriovorax sp. BSW11_IV]|uniref:hypothetical protein n=1 Tax=Bacteriovorax sp. BSW11_IV TaxID=1353529 RepID=UPI00038A4255|nr:hypothetical protein [Bacteriovorax sp. BSW11_IV]EQC46366.1 hypothetical protein M899_1975 [Bacteriovorax sp. BSW11_IV]